MAAQLHQLPDPEEAPAPESPQPSLEQLIGHTRDLIADGVNQARGIGELAFLEFELALSTSKWLMLAVVLLCGSGLLSLTFMMAALAVLFMDTASPSSVLLLCGLCNLVVASMLLLWIKSLSRKMLFRNLREQLSAKDNADNVQPE